MIVVGNQRYKIMLIGRFCERVRVDAVLDRSCGSSIRRWTKRPTYRPADLSALVRFSALISFSALVCCGALIRSSAVIQFSTLIWLNEIIRFNSLLRVSLVLRSSAVIV